METSRPLRLAVIAACALLLPATVPAQQIASQPYDWKNVAILANGFVNGIVFHPRERGLVYAYTDMGGAYRWDAKSGKYVPLNDWSRFNDRTAANLGVEAMAVDPNNADRVYAVIGTYDSPAGMLRSSDRGATWQRTDLPDVRVNGNGNGRNGGNRLLLDPNAPMNLWYGTRRDGLWRSTDGAATWSKVTGFTAVGETRGDAANVGVNWLLADATSGKTGTAGQPGTASRTLYAGVATMKGEKVFRSLDGGDSWQALPGQPTTPALYPIRAALSADGGTLFATYSNHVGPNGATTGSVYKVAGPAEAAPTWTAMPLPVMGNGGWSGVCIDPQNPNALLVSTLDRWGAGDDVYRSSDGGATWRALEMGKHRDDRSAKYAESQRPHWIGDVQIDPHDANRAILTTGYGLYETRDLTAADAGKSPTWIFENTGLEQVAAIELASPNAGSVHLFSAIGDRDGYRHVDFDKSPVDGVLGQADKLNHGTSPDIDVAWANPDHLVRTLRVAPYVQYSTDNGVRWAWMPDAGTGTAAERGRAWSNGGDADCAINAAGTRIVCDPAGTTPVRYSSFDGTRWGDWQTPTGTLPPNGAEIVADLGGGETFYAISGRTVSRSDDGGVTWSTTGTNAIPDNVNWIRAVPGQAGHLIASTDGRRDGGAWRSTDGGKTWARMAPGVVKEVTTVGVGAAAPGASYPALYVNGAVGDKTGYFRSDDAGATWTSISDSNQQFGHITVIQGDPRVYGRLYVGANGRGVLVGDIRK